MPFIRGVRAFEDETDVATAHSARAAALLAEIARLYGELVHLPPLEQPNPARAHRPSARYCALEARIRWHADQYTRETRDAPDDRQAHSGTARPSEVEPARRRCG